MLKERLIHVNSKGAVLDFKANRIHVEDNDLRDYEWSTETENDRISRFYKSITKKTLTFFISVENSKALEVKNAFYEHFEHDIVNMNEGYFEINNYRLYGFVTKSIKSDYLVAKRCLRLKLEYTCENPSWIKFNKLEFLRNDDIEGRSTTDKIYPYTYSYTYGKSNGSDTIYNDCLTDSDFILIVYGEANKPAITIDDHLYEVDYHIGENERMVIDSKNKKVYVIDRYGNETNIFNKRNKQSSIFQKIKSGANVITWSNGFGFTLTMREERSEPKWN